MINALTEIMPLIVYTVFLLTIINTLINISNHFKIKIIMGTIEQFQAQLSRIDAATSGIADELLRLKDQITNAGGLSPEVEAQVLNDLTAAADRLEGIGKPEEEDVEEENPNTDGGAGTNLKTEDPLV
jgi:hypothetical protein